MSDDRFAEPEAPEPDVPHVIRMLATVPLVWTGAAWVLEEPAVLRRDNDLLCTHGAHLDSAAARAKCDVEKERANGAPMPGRNDVAARFTDAIGRGPVEVRPIAGEM
jgi:hypothetical protein